MMTFVLHGLGQGSNAAQEEARRRAEVVVEALQRWYVPRTGALQDDGMVELGERDYGDYGLHARGG